MRTWHFQGLGVLGTIPIWCNTKWTRRSDLLRVITLPCIVENSTMTNWCLESLVILVRWNRFLKGKGFRMVNRWKMSKRYLEIDCLWTQLGENLSTGIFMNTRSHWQCVTFEYSNTVHRAVLWIFASSYIVLTGRKPAQKIQSKAWRNRD